MSGSDDELTAQVETLQARIGSLESTELTAAPPADLEGFETRIVALEEFTAAEPSTEIPADVTDRIAALETQVAAQAERVETLAATPASPATDVSETIAPLQAEIQRINEELAANAESDAGGVDSAITSRLDALEQQLAAVPQEGSVEAATADLASSEAVSTLEARVAELSTAVENAQNDELATRIDSLVQSSEESRAESNRRFDELTAEVGTVSEQLATLEATDESLRGSIEDLRNRVAELDAALSDTATQVSDLAGRVDAPGDRERAYAAMALAGLQGAVDRGVPYATYLDSLAASGLVAGSVESTLRERADAALPTLATLVKRWDDAAGDARRAAVRAEANSGVAGIFASARSLVDVAPADPGDGDDVGALVSRIGDRLEAGELADAVALWDRLPTASRDATADWGFDAKARLAVEEAVRGASDAVLSGSTGAGGQSNG